MYCFSFYLTAGETDKEVSFKTTINYMTSAKYSLYFEKGKALSV